MKADVRKGGLNQLLKRLLFRKQAPGTERRLRFFCLEREHGSWGLHV